MPVMARRRTPILLALSALVLGVNDANAKNYAFVIASKKLAIYETPFMDECPEGLAKGNDEFWWRALTPADRARLTENGTLDVASRQGYAMFRGSNGEQVCYAPFSVKDPPLRTVEGKISYGLDLDGEATAGSCPHQDFVDPDGRPGIDNQLYRLLGCAAGWRSFGFVENSADDDRKSGGLATIVMELSDVESLRNDGDVTVTFFHAIDPPATDALGRVLPYSSYRIDVANGVARYDSRVKGRIVEGVLTTDPADVELPFYAIVVFIRQHLRGMKLELKISDDGASAEGFLGGYHDVKQIEEYFRAVGGLSATGQFSCPQLFTALPQLADGHRDFATGACTSISGAYRVKAVAAFISRDGTVP